MDNNKRFKNKNLNDNDRDLDKQVSFLKNNPKQLKETLKKLIKTEKVTSELAYVKKKLNDSHTNNKSLRNEVDQLKTENEVFKNDNDALKNKCEELTSLNINLKNEKCQLSDKINELNNEVKQLNEKINNEINYTKDLKESLRITGKDNEELRKENHKVLNENKSLLNKYKHLENASNDLEIVYEKVGNNQNDNEIETIQDESEIHIKFNELTDKNIKLMVENTELKNNTNKLVEEMNGLKSEIEKQNQINANITDELNDYKTNAQELENDNNVKDLKIKELEDKNDDLINKNYRYSKEFQKKRDLREKTDKTIVEKDNEIKGLKETNNEINREKVRIEKENRQLLKSNEYLKKAQSNARRELLATQVSHHGSQQNFETTFEKYENLLNVGSDNQWNEMKRDIINLVNNHSRKHKITNKRKFEEIKSNFEIDQNLVADKASKVLEKNPGNKVSCPECDRKFSETGHLSQHLTKTHKQKLRDYSNKLTEKSNHFEEINSEEDMDLSD